MCTHQKNNDSFEQWHLPVSVIAVNNEDDTFGVVVVVAPQGSDFILTSDIPNREAEEELETGTL